MALSCSPEGQRQNPRGFGFIKSKYAIPWSPAKGAGATRPSEPLAKRPLAARQPDEEYLLLRDGNGILNPHYRGSMAGRKRRRRDDGSLIELIVRLVAIVFVLGFISPEVRLAVAGFGFLAICVVGIAFVAAVGWLIYRIATRSRRSAPATLDQRCDALNVGVEEQGRTAAAQHSLRINGSPSGWRNRIATRSRRNAPATLDLRCDALSVGVEEQGRTAAAQHPLRTNGSPSDWRKEQTEFQTTADLIEHLRAIDWFQFEKLVALVYRKLGYTVTRRGGANPDGGIDLLIEKAGQRSAVQCKQWKTWNVGVKPMREFLGALKDAGIDEGVFITLGGYTGEAKHLADKHRIEIVNEVGLARMIEATDARFDPETLEILNDTRKFCPKCESELVLRTARKGRGAGGQFWGCSAYPRCRFILRV